MLIHSYILKLQRPEQSGFTPGKWKTKRIPALRLLVERRPEFRKGMPAAYTGLKNTFDFMHFDVLWEVLRLRGNPTRITNLFSGLCNGTYFLLHNKRLL